MRTQHFTTPLGPMRAHWNDDGTLGALDFLDETPRELDNSGVLYEELGAYARGALKRFSVETRPSGTEFQMRVWNALKEIPWGATTTYGKLAVKLGSPLLTRAVGAANGKNPVAILIPCHRVVGADGSLTGYAGGLHRKEALLAIEGRRGQRSLAGL